MDVSQPIAALSKLGAAFKGFEANALKSANGVEASIAKAGVSVDVLHGKISDAGAAFVGVKASATNALTGINQGAKTTATAVGQVATAMGRVGTNATSAANKLGAAFVAAGGSVSRLNAKLGNLNVTNQSAMQSFQGTGGAANSAAENITKMGSSIERMVVSLIGLNLIKNAIGQIGTAAREAREAAEGKADASLDRRSEARELASLMHEGGPNDRVMARVYGIGMASGFNFSESNKFAAQFEGSVPLGIDRKNLREDQKKEVEIAAARTARRLNIDAGTAGDMAGTIAGFTNLNKKVDNNGQVMSAADAMASEMEAIAYGLNEGRGEISVLSRGEIKDAGKLMSSGRLAQRTDVGPFMGIASLQAGGTGAAAGLKQMDNALNRSTGDAGKFNKKHGISELKFDDKKLHKLKEVVDAARLASKDPNFDPNTFLAGEGFGSQEERSSLTNFLDKIDALDARLVKSREISRDAKGVREKNRAFEGGKESQMSRAKAAVDFARFKSGTAGEDLQIARMNAAARMEGMGLLDRTDQKVADAFRGNFGANEFLGMPSQARERVDAEVASDLELKLRNAGVDPKKAGLTYHKSDGGDGEEEDRLKIPEAIDALRKRGIDTSGNATALRVEAENMDVGPEVRAPREAAKLPRPVVPALPPPVRIAPPAVPPNGGGVVAPGGGPQASNFGGAGGKTVVHLATETVAALRRQTVRPLPVGAFPSAGAGRT